MQRASKWLKMVSSMNETNMIPAPWAAGQFEATAPFDLVVDQSVYYTVEAIRTVGEMQGANQDLYAKVLQPAGIPKDETTAFLDELIKAKSLIIVLTSTGNAPVYVPSAYLASFPAVDGVVFEHMCLIVDLGAVPPQMKDKIQEQLVYIQQYVASNIGVDAAVQVGVVPTKSYVPKEQADLWENSRQLKIADSTNLIVENEALKQEKIEREAYIVKLENDLKAKS